MRPTLASPATTIQTPFTPTELTDRDSLLSARARATRARAGFAARRDHYAAALLALAAVHIRVAVPGATRILVEQPSPALGGVPRMPLREVADGAEARWHRGTPPAGTARGWDRLLQAVGPLLDEMAAYGYLPPASGWIALPRTRCRAGRVIDRLAARLTAAGRRAGRVAEETPAARIARTVRAAYPDAGALLLAPWSETMPPVLSLSAVVMRSGVRADWATGSSDAARVVRLACAVQDAINEMIAAGHDSVYLFLPEPWEL